MNSWTNGRQTKSFYFPWVGFAKYLLKRKYARSLVILIQDEATCEKILSILALLYIHPTNNRGLLQSKRKNDFQTFSALTNHTYPFKIFNTPQNLQTVVVLPMAF